ncbi:hypothetical protein GGR54DRAFT_67280 [Hypoxylon sp. NC1633]|nr:hypothetical protein GGR54DRAFT_67280 [Hypoxylon sp. NC1633]
MPRNNNLTSATNGFLPSPFYLPTRRATTPYQLKAEATVLRRYPCAAKIAFVVVLLGCSPLFDSGGSSIELPCPITDVFEWSPPLLADPLLWVVVFTGWMALEATIMFHSMRKHLDPKLPKEEEHRVPLFISVPGPCRGSLT